MRRVSIGIGGVISPAMLSFAVIAAFSGLLTRMKPIGILLLIASFPIGAQAAEDPAASFEVVHCHASAETGDWAGVTVYCKAAAEAWAVAAQENNNDLRTTDLTNAAFDLILTGIGNKHTQMRDEARKTLRRQVPCSTRLRKVLRARHYSILSSEDAKNLRKRRVPYSAPESGRA